jgi:hypothetical protein
MSCAKAGLHRIFPPISFHGRMEKEEERARVLVAKTRISDSGQNCSASKMRPFLHGKRIQIDLLEWAGVQPTFVSGYGGAMHS